MSMIISQDMIDGFLGGEEATARVGALQLALNHPDTPPVLLKKLHSVYNYLPTAGIGADGPCLSTLMRHPSLPSSLIGKWARIPRGHQVEYNLYIASSLNPSLPGRRARSFKRKMRRKSRREPSLHRYHDALNNLLAHPTTSEREVRKALSSPAQCSCYTYGTYYSLPDEERERIVRGSEGQVARRRELAMNPTASADHLLILGRDDDMDILRALAGNPSTPVSLLVSLARFDPVGGYDIVRKALENPSTPIAVVEAQCRRLKKRRFSNVDLFLGRAAKHPEASDDLVLEAWERTHDIGILYAHPLVEEAWQSIVWMVDQRIGSMSTRGL